MIIAYCALDVRILFLFIFYGKNMKRISFLSVKVCKSFNRIYNSSMTVPATEAFRTLNEERPIKLKHAELIHEFIGGSPEKIRIALSRNLKLQLFQEKIIEEKLNIIKDMMLGDQYTVRIIQLLKISSNSLKQRYKLLNEYGFIPHKICVGHVNRCYNLFKTSVQELKKKELIKRDLNVIRNLWNVAGLDVKTCPEVPETLTLYDLKTLALKEFLKQNIDFPDDLFEVYGEELISKRLRNKSFETISQNLYIFQDVLGLSKIRLSHNASLLGLPPERTLDLMNRVKSIAGIDIKIILHLVPKICSMTCENLLNIIKYLEAENIPMKFSQRRLEIFTLSSKTVHERILEIKEEEFFRLNIKNPAIIDIILSFVNAKKRLALLEEMRLNPTLSCISIEKKFERYHKGGSLSLGADSANYIISELNIPREIFVEKIRVHRRWSHVPIIHIGRNLQTLRKHYTDDEIKKYIYILFYYSGRLNREMKELDDRKVLEDFKEEGKVKKEYRLPLVLYFLEKETNFSGESIWDPDDSDPYQDLPDFPVGRL